MICLPIVFVGTFQAPNASTSYTHLWRGLGRFKGTYIDPCFYNTRDMGVSKYRGGPPKSSMFYRVFHYFHHPFWGFSHYFWKHPYEETKEIWLWDEGKHVRIRKCQRTMLGWTTNLQSLACQKLCGKRWLVCWGLKSKLPLFSYGRDGQQPYSGDFITYYKDSLLKVGWPSPISRV